MLTAVTMSLALAHALELPGKRRLGKEEYCAVQTIDYSSRLPVLPRLAAQSQPCHC